MKSIRKHNYVSVTLAFFFVLGLASVLVPRANAQAASGLQATNDNLIAIDILLEPDQTMVGKANAFNARLRGNYPDGYSLDATHVPHVTLLQRYIRVRDFDAVTEAVTKVLAVERPAELQLTGHGFVAVPSKGVAVTLLLVERTPNLLRLQQKVADAVAPFAVSGGTAKAFIDTPPDGDIVPYVETFVPKASGENYHPHVTVGVASEDFVKQLKAEPFQAFAFSPTGVAIYQLGNFGVAAKKLWEYQAQPLASWNEGAAKQSILEFVKRVTTEGSPEFVPVAERIATFDNDGTLWCEEPLPVQLFFVLDRVKALEPQHPEWKTTEPFASVLNGDLKGVAAGGERGLMELVMATHTGMTTDEFEQIVKDWIATAKNPKTGKLFTEMTFQPMLELLAYLRANGFKTYIVSGGGVEFMRPWAQRVYGIPPEQIVGSSIKTKFEMRDGKPVLARLPELNFNDNNGGKAAGINEFIGRRPIAAFGNSTGDQQMLQYTQGGSGARFELLVLHDDATRDFAYGPTRGLPADPLVHFTPELDAYAKQNGWTIVSTKNDWNRIYAFQEKEIGH
jgi:hypothetical protein